MVADDFMLEEDVERCCENTENGDSKKSLILE
jgi:hypothetical protein